MALFTKKSKEKVKPKGHFGLFGYPGKYKAGGTKFLFPKKNLYVKKEKALNKSLGKFGKSVFGTKPAQPVGKSVLAKDKNITTSRTVFDRPSSIEQKHLDVKQQAQLNDNLLRLSRNRQIYKERYL